MEKITIGRDNDCTVCVNKTTVAWKHCSIKVDENGIYTVKNLDSDFETWVDGKKVENENYFVSIEKIRVGDVTLTWDEIKRDAESNTNSDGSVKKSRAGFVSFWLWLGIIVNLIMIPVGIIIYQRFANPGGYYLMGRIISGQNINPIMHTLHNHVFIMQVVCAVGGLLMIIFYSNLLHWKKIGFWGIVGTSTIINVINIIVMKAISKDYLELGLEMEVNVMKILIIFVISIVILWAILQIKKDDVSCWKQLE